MRSNYFIFSIYLIIIFLSGCSSGGGGDDGGSNNSSLPKTGTRVINGSIDAPPFDVTIGVAPTVTKASFSQSTGYLAQIAGSIGIIIKRANTEEVISNPTITLDEGSRKSVLFAGDYRIGEAQSFEIDDNPGELRAGFAKVRIINAVQGLRGVEARVGDGDSEIISLGSASSYIEVPAGSVTFSATSQLGGVASGSFNVEENKPYSILVTGDWGYFITSSLLLG